MLVAPSIAPLLLVGLLLFAAVNATRIDIDDLVRKLESSDDCDAVHKWLFVRITNPSVRKRVLYQMALNGSRIFGKLITQFPGEASLLEAATLTRVPRLVAALNSGSLHQIVSRIHQVDPQECGDAALGLESPAYAGLRDRSVLWQYMPIDAFYIVLKKVTGDPTLAPLVKNNIRFYQAAVKSNMPVLRELYLDDSISTVVIVDAIVSSGWQAFNLLLEVSDVDVLSAARSRITDEARRKRISAAIDANRIEESLLRLSPKQTSVALGIPLEHVLQIRDKSTWRARLVRKLCCILVSFPFALVLLVFAFTALFGRK